MSVNLNANLPKLLLFKLISIPKLQQHLILSQQAVIITVNLIMEVQKKVKKSK